MSKLIRRGAALVSGTHIYIGETASEGAIARVRREQISGQFIVTGCHQLRFGLRSHPYSNREIMGKDKARMRSGVRL